MAELVNMDDIPDKGSRGVTYPWSEWEKLLENGKALRLTREDMPENSFACRSWDSGRTRSGALNQHAKKLGLEIATRGAYIYLWRK